MFISDNAGMGKLYLTIFGSASGQGLVGSSTSTGLHDSKKFDDRDFMIYFLLGLVLQTFLLIFECEESVSCSESLAKHA